MTNENDNKQQELEQLQKELQEGGLSRREFVTRLKVLGIGFGAAFALGVRDAEAHNRGQDVVGLRSEDPKVDKVIEDGLVEFDEEDEDLREMAYSRYRRGYRRGYRRFYRRGYRRYRRVYRRGYRRIYRRGYRRYSRYYRRYRRRYFRY